MGDNAEYRFRMPVIRSGVRPKSAKLPWGTIVHPEFGMGYQRLTAYEIKQVVDRLYYVPIRRQPDKNPFGIDNKKFKKEDMDSLVNRLSKFSVGKPPDANRTVKSANLEKLGIVASFAWRGYN